MTATEVDRALRIVLGALAEGSLDQTQLRALQDALDVSYLTSDELRTLLALRDPNNIVSINEVRVNPTRP